MKSSRKRLNADDLICARIRERRLSTGLTQTTLARRAGLTPQQMQRYESGRAPITCAALLKIASALRVPPALLLEGETSFKPPKPSSSLAQRRSTTLDHVVTVAQDVLSSVPLAMFVTSNDGELLYVNEAGAKVAGRQLRLGRDKWCVSWKLTDIDGARLAHDQCPLALTVRSGRLVRGAVTVTHRPDGTRQAYMPFPGLLRDVKGNVVGGFNVLYPLRQRAEAAMLSTGD